jgi:hypothetical protein
MDPMDPFAGDPADPAGELARLDPEEESDPLTVDERADILGDLTDLEGFQALLETRGVRGLVVDCQDCDEPHFFDWELLRANLRSLLDEGAGRVHEPPFDPAED